LHREAIGGASIVSNPGCYPTCAGMALMPLARVGALPDTLVIDAKSGISGAGRQPTATNHFCSVTNDVRPYNLGRAHRHTPEIEQSLAAMGRGAVASHPRVIFCPHVVPLERGMLVTVVLEVPQLTGAEVHALYVEHYADECFVEVLPISEPARIRAAALSNNVVIGITPVEDTRHVVVTCAIDNLLKGAAGQAVQNMNLMFDLPETAGLAPTQVGTWSHLVTPDSLEIQS
jgi:N-acetyl-gamma-glutamyl-phosphate reductase